MRLVCYNPTDPKSQGEERKEKSMAECRLGYRKPRLSLLFDIVCMTQRTLRKRISEPDMRESDIFYTKFVIRMHQFVP